jgi:hypothetical protein
MSQKVAHFPCPLQLCGVNGANVIATAAIAIGTVAAAAATATLLRDCLHLLSWLIVPCTFAAAAAAATAAAAAVIALLLRCCCRHRPIAALAPLVPPLFHGCRCAAETYNVQPGPVATPVLSSLHYGAPANDNGAKGQVTSFMACTATPSFSFVSLCGILFMWGEAPSIWGKRLVLIVCVRTSTCIQHVS